MAFGKKRCNILLDIIINLLYLYCNKIINLKKRVMKEKNEMSTKELVKSLMGTFKQGTKEKTISRRYERGNNKELLFPRWYTTSSAAHRAVRQELKKVQFLNKNETTRTKESLRFEFNFKYGRFGVTKIGVNLFVLKILDTWIDPDMVTKFCADYPIITISDMVTRHFKDGHFGEGYYELKKGDRRRPNSKFLSISDAALTLWVNSPKIPKNNQQKKEQSVLV